MSNIIFNTELTHGAKGEKGDTGLSYEVPTGAVIAYDGAGVPDGYEETAAPLPPVPSGGVDFNEIGITINTDGASVCFISSDGWYRQTDSYVPFLRVGTANGMSLYGHTSFEVNLKFKLTSLSAMGYLLGNGSLLCMDAIAVNTNGKLTFTTARRDYTTTAALVVDTEYTLLYEVDISNQSMHYKIMSEDTVIEENTVESGGYDNRVTNLVAFSGNGGSYAVIGALYLPESYIKIDNVLNYLIPTLLLPISTAVFAMLLERKPIKPMIKGILCYPIFMTSWLLINIKFRK